ncbi:MAG: 50S ribosomal protein L4 [Bacteroidetes bacterium]|jgi:large subunit ribosomal protein L4|nr:50S ribosomal protein L4 [Bacteroidota bacterium]
MKLKIHKTDGKSSGSEADLNDQVFGIEPNETVLYEDVRRFLANKRQGTANTKERGEVRGGGRKAYKQKGTGMARRGSIRSPLLKGGGTVFGPKPRTYTVRLTKKARRLARKSALSLKASEDKIIVIEDFSFDEPKTKDIVSILTALGISDQKVLLLTKETDMIIFKSANNLQNVHVLEASKPSTYEIMHADVVVIQESALSILESSFSFNSADEEAA